ncbi:MAG: phosphoserine transaminase [Phycisphaerales bacterium]
MSSSVSTQPAALQQNKSSKRIFNFSAGPATLPQEVIEKAQQDMWNIFDTGIGIMEHSHRGPAFIRVLEEAVTDCRALADISDDYEVLFLQGGATLQFAMLAMNFLPRGEVADYLDTGVWAGKAIEEARKLGKVNVAFDGESCGYDHTPGADEINWSSNAAYAHYCSNNTIYGTRFSQVPETSAPLIADTSSEMFSRPIDIDKHAMIYAGAQKNLGPSGVVLVIIRKDFMQRAPENLPLLLDYREIAAKESCLNTPPTFGIYFMGQVFKWILRQGGLQAMEKHNAAKATHIYDAIDNHAGFYTCVSQPQCRSLMNISFRTPSADLDKKFIAEAEQHDMDGLKGYRSVGGIRASVYNAFPIAGCQVLADFMKDFAQRNG